MRFHHSTRRGRNRFSQGGNHHSAHGGTKFGAASHSSSLTSRWAQLSYCRQTNIHFNRRVPVELPDELRILASCANSGQSVTSTQQDANETMALVGREQSSYLQNGRLADVNRQHHHERELRLDVTNSQQQLNQFDQLSLSPEHRRDCVEMGADLMTQTLAHDHQHQHHHSHHHRQNSVRSNTRETTQKAEIKHQDHHQHQVSKMIEAENNKPTAMVATAGHNSQKEDHHQAAPSGKKLDLDKAREKLIAQVDKHPFWSTKAAKRMRLLDIHERQIYIYELTSYCEKRDLEWRYEAYRGTKLGSGPFGTTPGALQAGPLRRAPSTTSSAYQQRVPLSGAPSDQATTSTLQQQTPPSGEAANNSQPYLNDSPAGSFQPDANELTPPTATTMQHNSTPQRPQQFAFDVPFGNQTGGSFRQRAQANCSLSHQLQNQNQRQHEQLRRGSSTASRLRRSCSSATSSPVHSAPGTAVVQSLSSTPIQASPPGSSGGLVSTPSEPRPMPSADLVWSIEPPEHLRPALFASYVHTSEVPGTSFVKRCHGCDGRGRLKCTSCYGVGYEVCLSCTGKGSLRTYSAMSAGGGLGSSMSGRSGLGSRSAGESSSRDSAGGVSGSMWANADDSCSSSRLGADSRHDEPGGITSASSEICNNCSGAGQKRCWICAGRSYITCTACAGTGSLRCYLNLNISYTNHRDEVCLNNSDGIIPRDRLKLSSGLLLADEVADRLEPLASNSTTSKATGGGSGFNHDRHSATGRTTPSEGSPASMQPQHHNDSNNNNHHHHKHHQHQRAPTSHLEQVARPGELIQLSLLSAKLLDKHWHTYKHERLIKQRHRVTQIECSKIDWEFRKKRGHFVIYGDEQKVYIAKYPFKSICNIT